MGTKSSTGTHTFRFTKRKRVYKHPKVMPDVNSSYLWLGLNKTVTGNAYVEVHQEEKDL